MKGTLFSADFVKDSSDNLRLLELNTDTAILKKQAQKIDWSELISIFSSNGITKLDVVYKVCFHEPITKILQDTIAAEAPFITEFNKHPEDINTIYPTSIQDQDDRFILRLAYDESALFDSSYCKGRLELYKLFFDNGHQGDITNFYHSSTHEGTYDSIDRTLNNPNNVPDAAVKDVLESFNPIDFFKIGKTSETDEVRWADFIEENKGDNKIIEQFHFSDSSLDSENRLSSYRTFFILYGNDLDLLNLHSYKNTAIFDLPTDLSEEVDENTLSNKLASKHYYEFTTNTFKIDGAGLLSTGKILMGDGTYKYFSDVEVGETIQSFYIAGSPSVESDYETFAWRSEGSEYPEGSYLTSSVVVFKNVEDLHYNGLIEYVVDGDSTYSGTAKQFLVYDSHTNTTSYKHATGLNHDIDYFFKADGQLVDLDEVNYFITSDEDVKIVELDVEDTDTYIISGSTSFNSVVSHNAPCFVAGTKISKPDNSLVNIEDVAIGDEVLTFNFTKQTTESKVVRGLSKKIVDKVTIYSFADGTELQATNDHPLFAFDKGWVSNNPEYTFTKYQLKTSQVLVGDSITKHDGTSTEIIGIKVVEGRTEVFNLRSVEDNHNFYANEHLVHNRCFIAGTEISLANGDVKNIEDVAVGEKVLTYNEETKETEGGLVGDLKKHEVDSVIRVTLDNTNIIVTTAEHPFYVVDGGWIKAGELQPLDVCLKEDGKESLISTVEVLDEKHEVFNLLSISENHNFFANGILVHNK